MPQNDQFCFSRKNACSHPPSICYTQSYSPAFVQAEGMVWHKMLCQKFSEYGLSAKMCVHVSSEKNKWTFYHKLVRWKQFALCILPKSPILTKMKWPSISSIAVAFTACLFSLLHPLAVFLFLGRGISKSVTSTAAIVPAKASPYSWTAFAFSRYVGAAGVM